MDEIEKQELKSLLKWSPLIILSLPFQLIVGIGYLIIYGLPLLLIYFYKRIRWLFDNLSWYKSERKNIKYVTFTE